MADRLDFIGLRRALKENAHVKWRDDPVREEAVTALVTIGSQQALSVLTDVLQGTDYTLKSRIIKTLGRGQHAELVELLAAPLKEEDLKRDVVEALAQMRDIRALKLLVRALKDARTAAAAHQGIVQIGPSAVGLNRSGFAGGSIP